MERGGAPQHAFMNVGFCKIGIGFFDSWTPSSPGGLWARTRGGELDSQALPFDLVTLGFALEVGSSKDFPGMLFHSPGDSRFGSATFRQLLQKLAFLDVP